MRGNLFTACLVGNKGIIVQDVLQNAYDMLCFGRPPTKKNATFKKPRFFKIYLEVTDFISDSPR
jgi:hypothetical protein